MSNQLLFVVNKNVDMEVSQELLSGTVRVRVWDDRTMKMVETIIPPEEFVMLINLYKDTKEYDIQNDYINPDGKN